MYSLWNTLGSGDGDHLGPKEATMSTLHLRTATLEFTLGDGPAIRDITPDLQNLVRIIQPWEGVVTVNAVGSTASVTTIEYEQGAIEDLKRAINDLAPPDGIYQHNLAWQDGNGHSHVQAALLGPSVTLPLRKGRLSLGTWQQVVLINHDTRKRTRKVELTFIYMTVPGE